MRCSVSLFHRLFLFIFFCGLDCVGHSFAYGRPLMSGFEPRELPRSTDLPCMCYEQLRGELVQPQPTAGPICSKKDSFTIFFF
jgi:hypothetical protein